MTKPTTTPAAPSKPKAQPPALPQTPVDAGEYAATLKGLEWILKAPRSHNSIRELQFYKELCAKVDELATAINTDKTTTLLAEVTHDQNALVLEVCDDGEWASTMFSCHVDTVDHQQSATDKDLIYDPNTATLMVGKGDCLGADCGTGIYIMLRMIEARVPGVYVFHRGEECGGLGSKALAATRPVWAERAKHCIAFDRKGESEVITHQGGARCASDAFAKALAAAVDTASGGEIKWEPSPRGTYTDSKEYRKLIPECVNVAVGYYDQHSAQESQNIEYLEKLIQALVKVDWAALPVERKVTDPDFTQTTVAPRYYGQSPWGDYTQRDMWDGLLGDDAEEPDFAHILQVGELTDACEQFPAGAAEYIITLRRRLAKSEADVKTLERAVFGD